MNRQNLSILIIVILAVSMVISLFLNQPKEFTKITDFESCIAAGNPVLESYPRQCKVNGETFVEEIFNEEQDIQTGYFIEQFPKRAIEIVGGIPIEGFNPKLYKQAYPGLKDSDFNNAEAIGGIWQFSNNQLIFKQTQGNPISSAEGTLNSKGLETLLKNLAQRLNIRPTTEDSIDQIISIAESAPTNSKENYCPPESRNAEACIQLYRPVCGFFNPQKIQCIKYPCANTYSNSCFACTNENVLYWTEGECPK